MKIQYCSDLHLEFAENSVHIQRSPLIVSGDILILAGDIAPLGWIESYKWFWDWVSDHYRVAYWIPGNHEYYNYFVDDKRSSIFESIRENLLLLNNHSIEISTDTVIHFTTLWTRIGVELEQEIRAGMADFSNITYKGERLTTGDVNHFHATAVDYLEESFHRYASKTSIVVTHHVPTFKSFPAIYLDSPLRQAFAAELRGHIQEWRPKYWIYGHSHFNTEEFEIGETKLLTNQLGYYHLGETVTFERSAAFSL